MSVGIFPFEYHLHDLDNGLRLVTVPTPFPGLVALQIVSHVGSRNEVEEGYSGFAHFFEHMMFRGTPEYPPERYEAVLQETGASSNAYTDDDRTVYHTTVAKEDFERVFAMEADRFQRLEYPEDAFRTESLAVLGEYNKDSTEPVNKLFEVLRDTAFDAHTYKHTTMGFLRDIVRMPEMYEYSRQFFHRFYRPEYTTLVVVGDITAAESLVLARKYWGDWPRGTHRFETPAEPESKAPREARIPWQTHTLPYLMVAFRAPAYSDESAECASLDLMSFLGFAESSALYQSLVIEEQLVDMLWASNSDHVDPYLFTVLARVKDPADIEIVRTRILAVFEEFINHPVDAKKLEAVKSHLRYRFALSLNNSEDIASTLAHYVSLKRSPQTIDRLYRLYEWITPDELQQTARRYFRPTGRTVVTLEETR